MSYRPHVTLLEPPTFGGVDESSSDRLDSQTVTAVLPAPEVLSGGTDREDDRDKEDFNKMSDIIDDDNNNRLGR